MALKIDGATIEVNPQSKKRHSYPVLLQYGVQVLARSRLKSCAERWRSTGLVLPQYEVQVLLESELEVFPSVGAVLV